MRLIHQGVSGASYVIEGGRLGRFFNDAAGPDATIGRGGECDR